MNHIIYNSKIYKNILHYFIHFYFITFFEILFYKYYIYTYEQNIIYNMIDSTIRQYYDKDIDTFDFVNTTSLIQHCNRIIINNENNLNNINNALFYICDVYIYTISSILITFFIYDLYNVYILFIDKISHDNRNSNEYKIDDCIFPPFDTPMTKLSPIKISKENLNINDNIIQPSSPFSMTLRSHMNISQSRYTETNHINKDVNNNNYIDKYKKTPCVFICFYGFHSKFLYEISKVIVFILILGTFEYLFFTYIVCQFRFFNLGQILCTILNKHILQ
jgi:hypothetical protein